MEQNITYSEKLLNGILKVVVVLLIGILLSVVVAVFLSLFGII